MNPRVAPWVGWTMVIAVVLAIGLLYVLSTGKLLVSQRGALGGVLVRTEFKTAFPLVPGMAVRSEGTIAGTVEDIRLTEHGTAAVDLRLTATAPEPRIDASASIRQGDILGDTYVDLDVGEAAEPLGDTPISTDRTLTMPRLDELISTFDEPERDGLRAVLTELGRTVAARGGDLNTTMLRLRPGLEAVGDLLGELDGQERDLRKVVEESDRVVAQVAASDASIDRGLVALDRLLGTVAGRSAELDELLGQAPGAAVTARATLDDVGRIARRTQPLARRLAAASGELQAMAPLIEPFVRAVGTSSRELDPPVRRMVDTLVAARPVTEKLKDLSPADLLLPGAGLFRVLGPVLGEGSDLWFGAKSYGADPNGERGFGAVALEPGNQPTTPSTDPRRVLVRTGWVVTCESFGEKIRPGCLGKLLNSGAPIDTSLLASEASRKATRTQQDEASDQLLDYLLR